MGKDSKGNQQTTYQIRPHESTEELRKKAKETLEKANRLLAESGKHFTSRTQDEEDEKP